MTMVGATQQRAITIVAGDAGNLYPVAEKIRERFPNREIIIAGDNDATGKEKASRAAQSVRGRTVFPSFPVNMSSDVQGKAYTDLMICRMYAAWKKYRHS